MGKIIYGEQLMFIEDGILTQYEKTKDKDGYIKAIGAWQDIMISLESSGVFGKEIRV